MLIELNMFYRVITNQCNRQWIGRGGGAKGQSHFPGHAEDIFFTIFATQIMVHIDENRCC